MRDTPLIGNRGDLFAGVRIHFMDSAAGSARLTEAFHLIQQGFEHGRSPLGVLLGHLGVFAQRLGDDLADKQIAPRPRCLQGIEVCLPSDRKELG